MKRTLKRMDLTARSFFALIEPGSCFAGTLFELALAADRSYMLDDPERPNDDRAVGDERRSAADEQRPDAAADAISRRAGARAASCSTRASRSMPQEALEAGLVSFAPDELDWDDEVRLAVESARGACRPTR